MGLRIFQNLLKVKFWWNFTDINISDILGVQVGRPIEVPLVSISEKQSGDGRSGWEK